MTKYKDSDTFRLADGRIVSYGELRAAYEEFITCPRCGSQMEQTMVYSKKHGRACPQCITWMEEKE